MIRALLRRNAGLGGDRTGPSRHRMTAPLAASVALLAAGPGLAAAPQFSAEPAYVAPQAGPDTPTGVPVEFSAKLYVGKDKMRVDFEGMSRRSLIVDDANRSFVALFHDRKTYQQLATRPAEFLRIANPEDACPAWQQALGRPIQCQKAGTEVVDGRPTIRYTQSESDRSGDEIWVDPKLQYVIKWRIDAVEMELRNITEGPQPPDLFVIPAGYALATPQNGPRRQVRRP